MAGGVEQQYADYELDKAYPMRHVQGWSVLIKRKKGSYIGTVTNNKTHKNYFQKKDSMKALKEYADNNIDDPDTREALWEQAMDLFKWIKRQTSTQSNELPEQAQHASQAPAGGARAEADPEPPKGTVGGTERFMWNAWKERQQKAAKTEKAHVPKAAPPPKAPSAQGALRRLPVNAGKAPTATAPAPAPAPAPTKKRKAAEIEEPEPPQPAVEVEEAGESDGDFAVATRAPGKNAKGHSRRVGKSKKASSGGWDAAEAEKPAPRKKAVAEDATNAVELAGKAQGLAILAGAETLFRAQRMGSKGLRVAKKKHSQRSNIMPTQEELQLFESTLGRRDPLAADRDALLKGYLKAAHAWLWQLQLHFSVLLFGVGCKEKLLSAFCKEYLSGEDVLMVDGRVEGSASGARAAKALLNTISEAVLKQPHLGSACLTLDNYTEAVKTGLQRNYNRWRAVDAQSIFAATAFHSAEDLTKPRSAACPAPADNNGEPPDEPAADVVRRAADWEDQGARVSRLTSSASSGHFEVGEADPNWGGRFTHAKAKLYIVVQNIDGESLQSSESQRVLAALAECPSVSLIATCDAVNTPLLWSSEMLAQFRWSFQHVPTFESRPVPAGFALMAGRKGVASQDHALEYILGSLTGRHKELLMLLAQEKQKQKSSSNTEGEAGGKAAGGAGKGTGMDELYDLAKKAGIVSMSNQFHSYLKELDDHRLVSVTANAAKKKFVHICNDKLERKMLASL